jgi:hypothetical protein
MMGEIPRWSWVRLQWNWGEFLGGHRSVLEEMEVSSRCRFAFNDGGNPQNGYRSAV